MFMYKVMKKWLSLQFVKISNQKHWKYKYLAVNYLQVGKMFLQADLIDILGVRTIKFEETFNLDGDQRESLFSKFSWKLVIKF